jgi:K+-transporting ATPase KdpF subunit
VAGLDLRGARMNIADVLELIVSFGLLVYLTIALVRPEKF